MALVRLGSGAIEHLIDAGCEPSLVRFQGDGKQVLAGSRADRSLTIFDAASGRTAVRLPLPVEPANCCFNADGGQMFVTGPGMDAVVIVYPYQTEVGETILAGRTPDGMAVSATPQYLFVANPAIRQRHGAGYRYAQAGGGNGGGPGAAPHSDYAGQSICAGAELAVREHGGDPDCGVYRAPAPDRSGAAVHHGSGGRAAGGRGGRRGSVSIFRFVRES